MLFCCAVTGSVCWNSRLYWVLADWLILAIGLFDLLSRGACGGIGLRRVGSGTDFVGFLGCFWTVLGRLPGAFRLAFWLDGPQVSAESWVLGIFAFIIVIH